MMARVWYMKYKYKYEIWNIINLLNHFGFQVVETRKFYLKEQNGKPNPKLAQQTISDTEQGVVTLR